ncbi:hypothetical protein DL770_008533 [Monosporascus sp. CRB-9-2]|nr:hypothetical protein DL770_008533 [Monosporascus sp. CRB-9-2]
MAASAASTATTATAGNDVDTTLPLEKKISQAIDEGHDADIPSNVGYVLDERAEQRRRQSLASRRGKLNARKSGNDLEKGPGSGAPVDNDDEDSDESMDDTNVVWWDGPDDPENPYNWPGWRKTLNVGCVSAMTLVSPLASSIFAPGVPQVMAEFGSTSLELASFVVSVYVLGFAAGPMVLAPLSEIYGRVPIYHIGNIGFVAFTIGCALAPSLNSLIVFRFLCGVFGSAPMTNGGGTIADTIEQSKRGAAMAAFSIGPLLGPIIGPVGGGFLADAKGWRWAFWLLVILGGALALTMLVVMKESYAPVVLERKAARLRKETGNQLLRSKLDVGLSATDYFKRGIVRPFRMLFFSPVVAIMAIYLAIVYSYLYLLFTTFTDVFMRTYGFSASTVGLSYLGLGVGSMIGLAIFSMSSDKYLAKKAAETDADGNKMGMKPEHRLPPLPVGATLLPIGLFIYGWTAEYKVHWIVPIIGTGIIGIGNLMVFMGVQLYLVDAFSIYAASALASNTVVRSIAGAVVPLAGLPMYEKLGLGWGNSLLGFIAIALLPVSVILMRYGEYLRKRFEIKDL